MSKDYYQILGVSKTASEDELKKAFRRLAHEHHPDKGGEASKFKDINEAYQVLGDKQKRATYDQFGSAAFDGSTGSPFGNGAGGFGGFDFGGFSARGGSAFGGDVNMDMGDLGDVLGEMFGFGGGRGGSTKQSRGQDIEMDVQLAFSEAAFGMARAIKLYKHAVCSKCNGEGAEPGTSVVNCTTCQGTGQVKKAQRTMFGMMQTTAVCSECHGRGKKPEKPCALCRGLGVERREQTIQVEIPAGIDNGEVLKVSSQGEAAPYGGRAGDLYLRIRVKSDPRFERQGTEVSSTVNVPFSMLALGGTTNVETLDGPVTMKIPEGTHPGTVFMLRGKGIPFMRSKGRGDHAVKITTETPNRLTREQKQALEELKRNGL